MTFLDKDHENGPFGRYQRASTGHLLNALCAFGIPLNTVEDIHTKTIPHTTTLELWHRSTYFGKCRYFEGIDRPLFNFEDRRFMEQQIEIGEDGVKKPKFRLVLSGNDTPGFIIWGHDATPELHDFLVTSTLAPMGSTAERYKQVPLAAVESSAFFQGGKSDLESRYFFVEFFVAQGAQAFMDYVNENYKPK